VKKKSKTLPESGRKKELLWGIKIVSELGLSMIVPLVAGAYLGSYLDTLLNSRPKLTLSFIFIGLILGIATLYKIVKENIN